uniref:Ribosomal protein L14 n=1 Tax=Gloeochaete wittrockiana TaxID=38269 RepID=A0A096Y6R8_9EUKA|nr:ribosomal protein L14 [Gloeochaete wittrockiana]AIM52014.1 ribosomal protein L14 [Gloeochaete wittrockiana]
MIQNNSKLSVAENSGAKIVRCIQNKKTQGIIICSVKKTAPNSKVKKGQVITARIIKEKSKKQRPNGSFIQFKNTSVILVKVEKKGMDVASTRPKGAFDKNLNKIAGKQLLPNVSQY